MTTSRSMPPHVRNAFDVEMTRARAASDLDERWRALERAHILSQPWPRPHVVAHWRMLLLAVGERDRREAVGQLVRLVVAAPGSAAGRYPAGNTGRSSVGLLQPMAVPDDLAAVLHGGSAEESRPS